MKAVPETQRYNVKAKVVEVGITWRYGMLRHQSANLIVLNKHCQRFHFDAQIFICIAKKKDLIFAWNILSFKMQPFRHFCDSYFFIFIILVSFPEFLKIVLTIVLYYFGSLSTTCL